VVHTPPAMELDEGGGKQILQLHHASVKQPEAIETPIIQAPPSLKMAKPDDQPKPEEKKASVVDATFATKQAIVLQTPTGIQVKESESTVVAQTKAVATVKEESMVQATSVELPPSVEVKPGEEGLETSQGTVAADAAIAVQVTMSPNLEIKPQQSESLIKTQVKATTEMATAVVVTTPEEVMVKETPSPIASSAKLLTETTSAIAVINDPRSSIEYQTGNVAKDAEKQVAQLVYGNESRAIEVATEAVVRQDKGKMESVVVKHAVADVKDLAAAVVVTSPPQQKISGPAAAVDTKASTVSSTKTTVATSLPVVKAAVLHDVLDAVEIHQQPEVIQDVDDSLRPHAVKATVRRDLLDAVVKVEQPTQLQNASSIVAGAMEATSTAKAKVLFESTDSVVDVNPPTEMLQSESPTTIDIRQLAVHAADKTRDNLATAVQIEIPRFPEFRVENEDSSAKDEYKPETAISSVCPPMMREAFVVEDLSDAVESGICLVSSDERLVIPPAETAGITLVKSDMMLQHFVVEGDAEICEDLGTIWRDEMYDEREVAEEKREEDRNALMIVAPVIADDRTHHEEVTTTTTVTATTTKTTITTATKTTTITTTMTKPFVVTRDPSSTAVASQYRWPPDGELVKATLVPMVEILVNLKKETLEEGGADDLDEGIGEEDREFEMFRKFPLRIFRPLAPLREEEEEGPIDLEALKAEIRAKAVRPTKKPSGLKPGKRQKKMIGPPGPPEVTVNVKKDTVKKDFYS